ncbi:MAG: T9SS type A sorting domain-containing protein [Chlorobiota bacterium]|nr:T9SS type A sorting domain-containing protein [Chlorobiota bacterium]QQS65609.1 MAG: T9SS type A sorting domain-containing protein [Chlorobiota bacterium]
MKNSNYILSLFYEVILVLILLVFNTNNLSAQHAIQSRLGGGEPVKKELSSSVSRSLLNETITLKSILPENIVDAKISIYNMLGNLIDERNVMANEKNELTASFSTKGFPNGPYIVILFADNQKSVSKVMISR